MLTVNEVLTSSGKYPDRAKSPKCTAEVKANVAELLRRVNPLLAELGVNPSVNSGFRTSGSNAGTAGAAKKSSHMEGKAVDLFDTPAGALEAKVTEALLKKYDLYKEDGSATPGWVHLTTRPPKSGKRIFLP